MPFTNPIVAGSTLVREAIQSEDYRPGLAGWIIRRDGSAEFNTGVYRGSVIINGPDGLPAVTINADGILTKDNTSGSAVQMTHSAEWGATLRLAGADPIGLSPLYEVFDANLAAGLENVEQFQGTHSPYLKIEAPYIDRTGVSGSGAPTAITLWGTDLDGSGNRIVVDATVVEVESIDVFYGIHVGTDLTVTGNATVSGATTLNGTTTTKGLTVNGNATVSGATTLNGTTTTKGLTVNGNATVSGNIDRSGEAWKTLTLQNAWTHYSTLKYRKLAVGNLLQICGRIMNGNTAFGTVYANIPAGYRPLNTLQYMVCNNATGTVIETEIDTAGNMKVLGSWSTDMTINLFVPLDYA